MEPIYNPGQPHLSPITGGFVPGRIAHITGTFTPVASSIVIKFQSGPNGDPTDEVGLCIYGRVNERIVGRNSFTRMSGWGQEESTGSVPFAPGQPFDVTILCDPTHYKIAVNQQHIGEYNHRTDPSSMNYLNVASSSQDITLGCIWIEDLQPQFASAPQQPQPGLPYPTVPPVGSIPPQGGEPLGFNMGTGGAPSPHFASGHYNETPPTFQQGPVPQYQLGVPQYGQPVQQSHQSHDSKSNKGLLGMVGTAGAAVAGALGASHLLGKSKVGGGYPGHGGYSGHGGYPGYGGYPGGGSHGSSGGLIGKALAVGSGFAGAAMMKNQMKGMGKGMKYGVPLAGVGMGGYMMHKGMKHGFHHGSSSSSSSSEEEE